MTSPLESFTQVPYRHSIESLNISIEYCGYKIFGYLGHLKLEITLLFGLMTMGS
jgi:hypothetical protein